MMKNVLRTGAAAALACSTPAWAGNPYVSVEAGIGKVRGNDVDETVDFSTIQTPAAPIAPPSVTGGFIDDVFGVDYGRERNLGLAAGYDFGWFRPEIELSHKRAGVREIQADDGTIDFLAGVNQALNRPSASPDPGAPGRTPLTLDDFQSRGSVRLLNVMANLMFDIPVGRVTLSAGGGLGKTFGRAFGDKDQSKLAGQYMIGARLPLTAALELGVKYRYFNSGILKFDDRAFEFTGNPDRLSLPDGSGGTAVVDRTTSARIVSDIEGEYRSRALLVGLTYSFGR